MEEVKKTEPKNLIGKAEQKSEIAQKVVVSDEPLVKEDPYGGTLTKTNYLLFGLLLLSVIVFIAGLGLMIYYIVKCSQNGDTLTFSKIKLGVIILSVGFVCVVLFGILKGTVEAKRRAAYSSKHQTKKLEKFEPKERQAEGAKRGQSTSETTLTISETKEDYRYCPHCHARIPQSTGMFCPKCGKRINEVSFEE